MKILIKENRNSEEHANSVIASFQEHFIDGADFVPRLGQDNYLIFEPVLFECGNPEAEINELENWLNHNCNIHLQGYIVAEDKNSAEIERIDIVGGQVTTANINWVFSCSVAIINGLRIVAENEFHPKAG